MQHGKIISLKPDLFAATKSDGYEDRWFIEIDLSTESPSTIIGKCDRYRDYYRSSKRRIRREANYSLSLRQMNLNA